MTASAPAPAPGSASGAPAVVATAVAAGALRPRRWALASAVLLLAVSAAVPPQPVGADPRGRPAADDGLTAVIRYTEYDGRRIPVPGGTHDLGVWNTIEADWDPAAGAYMDVSFGSSHLQAVGWNGSGCPEARTLLTYSQSSNPRSPHSSDQTALLPAGQWVTFRFCERDILASPSLRTVTVHGVDHP
ncbi:penicillin acylase family protein [Streptomyces griseoviridis]